MLTEDQKSLLRAEEVFRAQVRQEFAGRKEEPTRWSRAAAFLGTPLGLTFLSMVLIPAFLWVANFVEHYYATRDQHAEVIQNLDLEISYRLSTANAAYPAGGGMESTFFAELNNPRDSWFPQFQGKTTSILMFQLERTVPDEKKEAVKLAREALTKKKRDALRIRDWLPPEPPVVEPQG